MAAKKRDGTPVKRADLYKGLKPVLVKLRDDQDEALAAAALARQKKSGAHRADKSAIVREALDRHPDLKPKR